MPCKLNSEIWRSPNERRRLFVLEQEEEDYNNALELFFEFRELEEKRVETERQRKRLKCLEFLNYINILRDLGFIICNYVNQFAT